MGRIKKEVLDFNHISSDLTEEEKKTLEEYYTAYHKKWWTIQKLKKDCDKKKAMVAALAGALGAAGIGSAVGTANPFMLGLLAASAALMAFLKKKKKNYGGKSEQAHVAEIKYKEVLDTLETCMRGGVFNNKEFVAEMSLIIFWMA